MCKVFLREAGINDVTDGTLTCTECFIEAGVNIVTDGTLTHAKWFIESLALIMLLLAHSHVQSVS